MNPANEPDTITPPEPTTTEPATPTTAPATPIRPKPRRTHSGGGRSTLPPWAFLAPALLLFLVFIAIPVGYAVYLSLMRQRSSGGAYGVKRPEFAGLENYGAALTDPELVDSLLRLARFAAISVPLTLGLALLFALLLDLPRARAKRFTRTAIFLPYAVPGVIGSLLWGFLYLPSTSPVNRLLDQLGLPAADFLNGGSIYGSLGNIAIWGGVGFNMVVLYTSLRSIPAEVTEAAAIDGASQWQIAWRIKVPLLAPALVLTLLFSVIATLQTYSEPMTLLSMSPSISSSFFPMMKIYQDGFGTDDLSGSAAMSVVLAAGTVIVSLGLLRMLQRRTISEDA
ncbi:MULTISPECIES: carbohydrate ABC transporter permease [unclassified Streptomyces]|uniref:carbohydrate ABC transporter permease n=1 Tax=unclassified Streptomyces TaxID=2593676 RepID=UPI00278BFA72|nr:MULTISPECIES: sugar ABC transporter permease [unclassified Streptomyces]